MEFSVDKHLKKKFGRLGWTGSVAGKIWIGIAIALIIFGIVVWQPLYTLNSASADEEIAAFGVSVAIEGGILVAAFLAIICSYRQLTRNSDMRGDESLWIDKGILAYTYHEKGGFANMPNSGKSIWVENLIQIDLNQTTIEFSKKNASLGFKHGISLFYRPVGNNNPEWIFSRNLDFFEIHTYFNPSLEKVLQECVPPEKFVIVD